jgi:hypothetical protein
MNQEKMVEDWEDDMYGCKIIGRCRNDNRIEMGEGPWKSVGDNYRPWNSVALWLAGTFNLSQYSMLPRHVSLFPTIFASG